MSRLVRPLLLLAVLTVAACATPAPTGGSSGVVSQGGISAPGVATATATPLLGDSATEAPPTSTPTTIPTVGPTPNGVTCIRETPSIFDTGTSKLGAFNAQRLPKGWKAGYDSESEVLLAIDAMAQGLDWPCFQTFYPGATTVYKAKRALK